MDELGRLLRDKVRDVVDAAKAAADQAAADGGTGASSASHTSGTSFAAAVNVGGHGRSASAYVDDEVIIVERDGERVVRRVTNEEADRSEPSEPES